MNDYMTGHIDACAKLASNREDFISMIKKATNLVNPKEEKYVIERLKDFVK